MKKNSLMLFMIIILIFTGCVQETEPQLVSLPSAVNLKDVGTYTLDDYSDFGLWSLSFDRQKLAGKIAVSDIYSLVVDEKAYTLKTNPMNHRILETLLPCEIDEMVVRSGEIKIVSDGAPMQKRDTENVSIAYVYIQRDQVQNETDLYELKLADYLSLKNIGDPFVMRDGKLIRPSHVKSSEGNVYSIKRYYDARQASSDHNVKGALDFLKSRPNHDELFFTGNPNRVTSIAGSVTVEKPDKKGRLFQIGTQGDVTESGDVTYSITDDSLNSEITVVFNRKNLKNVDYREYHQFSLYLQESTQCTFQNISGELYETVIPYATTSNTEVVRNARFEAFKKPGKASDLLPDDGATDVTVDPTLTWTAGTDAVSYTLYFGTDTSVLKKVKEGITITEYATTGLNHHETYYWQVESISTEGLTALSTQSSFTTSWFAGGAGTADDPWHIETPEQLDAMRNYLGSKNVVYYRQTADIDLSGFENWQPVGNNIYRFYGRYNGNDHKITNLTINRPSDNYIGLFGYTQNASISHLQVIDADVQADSQVGILAGYTNYGTITNISVEGTVTGQFKAGGAIGYVEETIVEDSSASVTVTADGFHSDFIGGFIGLSKANIKRCFSIGTVEGVKGVGGFIGENTLGTIEECYSTADVTATDKAAGGFAGRTNGTIINCYSTGAVTGGTSQTGGFIGYTNYNLNWRGKLENCYAVGAVSSVSGTTGGFLGEDADENGTFPNNFWDRETTGQPSSAKGTGKTTEQMKEKTTFSDASWDFTSVWGIDDGSSTYSYPYLKNNQQTPAPGQSSLFAAGDGTKENPWQISSAELLNRVRDVPVNPSGSNYFIQTADIDLSGYPDWQPIDFSGQYDGNGHSVNNLTITSWAENDKGLFGVLLDATITGLTVGNADIVGNIYNGILFGRMTNSHIADCVATGTVSVSGYASGLLGGKSHGEIVNCYTEGTITSNLNNNGSYMDASAGLGGLIGDFEGTAVNSYADVAVISNDMRGVGGFIGFMQGSSSISNCYALGSIYAQVGDGVGGFVGFKHSSGLIDKSYSVGKVTASNPKGFCGGPNNTSGITNSFFDYQAAGTGNTFGGTYKTTEQMKTKATFTDAGWNFTDDWNIVEDGTYVSYPYLRVNPQSPEPGKSPFASGQGTKDNPWQIETADDLNKVRLVPGDASNPTYFVQTANIDLSGYSNWEPIATGSKKFYGQYDGDNYTISNLTVDTTEYYGSLFGNIQDGTVTNLTVGNASVKGTRYVGILFGKLNDGAAENCVATGTVDLSEPIGGLLGGLNSGNISNCHTEGTITSTLDHIYGTSLGGFIGQSFGTITRSYSDAAVFSTKMKGVAGFVGYMNGGTVSKCYSLGSVYAQAGRATGGFVGYKDAGDISMCYSLAEVTNAAPNLPSRYTAGFVGEMYVSGTIDQCYAAGQVDGHYDVGGFAADNGNVTNSFFDRWTTGQGMTAEGSSETTADMKTKATFTAAGWDFNNDWVILEGNPISYPYLRDNPQNPEPGRAAE